MEQPFSRKSVSTLHELDLGQHTLFLMSNGSMDLLANGEHTPFLADNMLSLDSNETYRLYISLHEHFKQHGTVNATAVSSFGQTSPRPQSGKAQRPVVQAVVNTLTDCSLGEHTWKPLLVRGERMCTICHLRAYCPGCMPDYPQGARIASCSEHAEGREQA